ncbi:MAG: protoporphyrinogen oxidase [Elusimicrobia bacterium]|nr:protoporphyrinogen oxidase [Elusimicrobiota bacterium]
MRVLVVGGGVAGLSCVHDLLKGSAGHEATLLEASGRLGGKLLGGSIDGVAADAGPDSFLSTRPWALELIRELGLFGEVLCTERQKRDVFVLSRGKLRKYPEGLMMLIPSRVWPFLTSDLLPLTAKLRIGLEFFIPRLREERDESLAEFGLRRFGEAALRTVIEPVFAGIYAGDVESLSLASAFPLFRELEREYGSVLRGVYARRRRGEGGDPGQGLTMFVTLKGGVARLADALAERARPCVRLKTRVASIRREKGIFRVSLEGGETIRADAVVLAAPTDAAAAILREDAPELACMLEGFQFSSTAVVNLLYDSASMARPLEGFGFLVERGEGVSLTAATFTSNKFPGRVPEGKTLIRCYFGGAGREGPLALDDDGLLRAARSDLRRILGLEAAPLGSLVHRWPKANALYNVGHGARVAALDAKLSAVPGLLLAGGCYRGIGIPECIRSGREAARRILESRAAPTGGIV